MYSVKTEHLTLLSLSVTEFEHHTTATTDEDGVLTDCNKQGPGRKCGLWREGHAGASFTARLVNTWGDPCWSSS